MATQTEYPYIVRIEQTPGGEPIVKGVSAAERAIVENLRLGLTPTEIPLHLRPPTLAHLVGVAHSK